MASRVANVLMREANRLHVWLYRRSDGRRTGSVRGVPVLLLTTTGRMSGKPRTHPLGYDRDGDGYVVIASNGGSDSMPAWWLNLKSDPKATVEVGGKTYRVTATDATGPEYDRLWDQMTGKYPNYVNYRTKTSRRIPVVRLDPEP